MIIYTFGIRDCNKNKIVMIRFPFSLLVTVNFLIVVTNMSLKG